MLCWPTLALRIPRGWPRLGLAHIGAPDHLSPSKLWGEPEFWQVIHSPKHVLVDPGRHKGMRMIGAYWALWVCRRLCLPFFGGVWAMLVALLQVIGQFDAGSAYPHSQRSDCHCWNDGKDERGKAPRNWVAESADVSFPIKAFDDWIFAAGSPALSEVTVYVSKFFGTKSGSWNVNHTGCTNALNFGRQNLTRLLK